MSSTPLVRVQGVRCREQCARLLCSSSGVYSAVVHNSKVYTLKQLVVHCAKKICLVHKCMGLEYSAVQFEARRLSEVQNSSV